jgi:hypothetical protein
VEPQEPTSPGRRGVDRVSIQDAARRLGVSEGAVRKRVTRGTLHHDKADDGRVYVYLDAGVDAGQDAGVDANNSALISQLRDEISYLREESRRKDEIIMQQAMAMRQLSAPSDDSREEPTESPESPGLSETPTEVSEGSQAPRVRPQQRSGWLAPVDKIPWWHYVLGLLLVFGTSYLTPALGGRLSVHIDTPVTFYAVVFAEAWAWPGVFGFWVGFRQRNPNFRSRILPFGALVGVVAALGVLVSNVVDSSGYYPLMESIIQTFEQVFDEALLLAAFSLPVWLLYVSAALIGNAWQRRRIGRISGTTPASPVSRTTLGAGQQPRKDLTPAQQAIIGWGGTIISALITLVGTIITVRGGP